MAGLAAAARARELGAEPVVLEKGDRPGGSMLLSSGVIWRYRTVEDFRAECPDGDPALQRVIIERLDDALEWLSSLGAPVVDRDTGNPRTIGMRFDTRGLTETLVRVIGDDSVRLSCRGQSLEQKAVILATGGFPVRLARERGLLLRSNRWSDGDGLDLALGRGAATAGDLDEFYGRAMPAAIEIEEQDFVRLAQLYGRFAEVVSEDWLTAIRRRSRLVRDPSRPGDRGLAGWPGLVSRSRGQAGGAGSRADRRRNDRGWRGEAGAVVRDEPPLTSVLVQASVTQTLGGLRIDERARVYRRRRALRGGS